MAKSKKTYEELVEAQATAKTNLKEAKKNLTTYLKENKLKRSDDHSGDKKHGKKIGALEKKIATCETRLEKATSTMKANKPATTRKSKYEYPADVVTSEQKKKYRQAQRAAANKGAKDGDTKKGKTPAKKKAAAKAKSSKGKASKKKVSKKKSAKSKKKDD